MQTIFFIVLAWVAFIWAIVLAASAFNIYKAVKNRGVDESENDKAQPDPTIATQPAAPPTIAGMPAGAYYATQTTHMTNPTHTTNHTSTPTIIH